MLSRWRFLSSYFDWRMVIDTVKGCDEESPVFVTDEVEKHDRSILPGLPDDIAFQCLARVPLRYHPVLAQVCKQWKETLDSSTLYSVRKEMGVTEGWVYALSRDNCDRLHWYLLDSVKREWMELPGMPTDFSRRYGTTCHVLDRELFVMGGGKKYMHPTPEVIKYDPLLNQWKDVSPMGTARSYFVAGTLQSQLYAVGGMGTNSENLTSWEVFDPHTNSWSSSEDPNIVSDIGELMVFDGKFFIRHICPINFPPSYAAQYDPMQNAWAHVDNEMTRNWSGPTAAIGTDIYMLDQTFGLKLMVFERETSSWKALGRLSPSSICPPCRMAAVDRNLYVVGRGHKTIVVNVDMAARSVGGVLITSSVQGLKGMDNVILSCHVIDI